MVPKSPNVRGLGQLLTPTELLILAHLVNYHPQSLSGKHIRRGVQTPFSTMYQCLRGLKRKGIVVSEQHPLVSTGLTFSCVNPEQVRSFLQTVRPELLVVQEPSY